MKTHTVFTLRDKSRHDTINAAMEHCLEQMGAGLRTFVTDIVHGSGNFREYAVMLDIVDKQKYDNDMREYIAWRDEWLALKLYDSPTEETDNDT